MGKKKDRKKKLAELASRRKHPTAREDLPEEVQLRIATTNRVDERSFVVFEVRGAQPESIKKEMERRLAAILHVPEAEFSVVVIMADSALGERLNDLPNLHG